MVKDKKIGIFSFFSGIGILDLGFERAGLEIAYVNEIIPSFLEGYKYSREKIGKSHPRYGYYEGDINKLVGSKSTISTLREKASRDFDLVGFIGGPPCPDFSVGGKNKGKDGENGKLSLSYVNLIIQEKPDFFLFENVKGLWSTKQHREFYDSLKKKLSKAGYVLFDRLINSIEYGAPQDRNRIILVGFKKELVKDETEFPWSSHLVVDRSIMSDDVWPNVTPFKSMKSVKKPKDVREEFTVEYWFKRNQVENHPNSEHFFQPRAGITRMREVSEGDVSRKSYKRLHRWRYSPTVCYGNNEVHLHPYKPRRLSVAEALALQSLPKDFSLPGTMSLSHMFKSIGNGVPLLVAEGLANTLKMYVNTNNETNGIIHRQSNRPATQKPVLSVR